MTDNFSPVDPVEAHQRKGATAAVDLTDPHRLPLEMKQWVTGHVKNEVLLQDLTGKLNPVNVAAGSSGQVLTTSAGGVPTWTTSTPGATVATTIAGLGTAYDGKEGLLRFSTGPYDYITVTWDAAIGSWVSEITPVITGAVSSANSTSWVAAGNFVIPPWGRVAAMVTAGLLPYYRITGLIVQTGTGENMAIGISVGSQNAHGQIGATSGGTTTPFGTDSFAPTSSGVTYTLDGGWTTNPITYGNYLVVSANVQSNATANAKSWLGLNVYMRWMA